MTFQQSSAMSSSSSSPQLNTIHLNAIFNNLDTNGDGLLSLDDLTCLVEKIIGGTSRVEVELLVGKDALLDPLDFIFFYQTLTTIKGRRRNDDIIDDDGGVGVVVGENSDGSMIEEVDDRDLEGAFKVFDLNGDGFISCEELRIALSKFGLWDECCRSGRSDCETMIGVHDVNGDGFLDFEEFKNMMMSS